MTKDEIDAIGLVKRMRFGELEPRYESIDLGGIKIFSLVMKKGDLKKRMKVKWKDYHDKTYGKDTSIDNSNFIGKTLIKMIEFYQWRISPYLGSHCRFQPSCSEYMVRSIKKYGFIKGSMKGFWRILRCNPFCKCGVDEP